METDNRVLPYANVAQWGGALVEVGEAGEWKVTCPRERRRTAVLAYLTAGATIASLMIVWIARTLAPAIGFGVWQSVAMMTVLAIAILGIGLLFFFAVPRTFDVVRVNDRGVRLEEWADGLSRTAELTWEMAEPVRVVSVRGRAFVVLGPEVGGFAIPWHAHEASARTMADALSCEIAKRRSMATDHAREHE